MHEPKRGATTRRQGGKGLAERPRRPAPRPCPRPQCQGADVIIWTVTTCAGCGDVLDESEPRRVAMGAAEDATPKRCESIVSEMPPLSRGCSVYLSCAIGSYRTGRRPIGATRTYRDGRALGRQLRQPRLGG